MRLLFNQEPLQKPALPEEAVSAIQTWSDQIGNLIAQGYSAREQFWIHWPDFATFGFDNSDVVRVFPKIGIAPEIITDLYSRSVFPLILQSRGIEIIHASAILTSKGVVAFCADSGSGKSTLAFGLFQRGQKLWGDDAVTIYFEKDLIISFPLPFSSRLLPDAISFLDADLPQKNLINRVFNDPVDDDRKSILAICLLTRVDNPPIEIIRLKPSEAFPRLLAQAYYFQIPDPQHKPRMVKHYLDVSNHIPVFELKFPLGFQYFSDTLDQIEQMIKSA